MVTRESLLKISRDARRRYAERWQNQCSAGRCDTTSWNLSEELEELGIPNLVIVGLVATEDAVWLEDDMSDKEKEELGIPLDKFAAYHYWIEVYTNRENESPWVVDITADQFNDLIVGKKFPQVIVAKYKDLPRHFRTGPA